MFKQFTSCVASLVMASALLTACSSVRVDTGGASRNSGAGADIFADLPTTRPEVTVKSQSAELFEQSLIALEAEDLGRAEGLLNRVTELQPELSGPWVNLGQVYLAGERAVEARAAFERAIAANPTNCAAYNQLGVLARQQGELGAAERSYLACIERNPDFPQVYLNLGILYELYLGRLPQALEAYRTYQSLVDMEDTRVKGWVLDLERRL